MDLRSIVTPLIALIVIGALVARQLRWRDFDPARVLRLPIVLGGVGLVMLADLHGAVITTVDATLLVVELLISIGLGLAMGRLAHFRADPNGSGAIQSRTGWAGAALWAVLIAVRVGFDALGSALGAQLLTQTGVILVLLAASRATAALAIRAREPHRLVGSA